MLFQNRRGFTLTELIVVMGIFLTIIMITATAFKTIVNSSSQLSKSAETQIEGIVGLEMLRADLESAGFGLPWEAASGSASVGCTYAEAVFTNASTGLLFNDSTGNAPRPVLSGNSSFNKVGNVGSKYLVIKSTMAAANDTSKKWATVAFDKDGIRSISKWGAADRDFTVNERIIVVKNSLMSTPVGRKLMVPASGVFFSRYSSASNGTYMTLINTHQNGDTFEVYGINPTNDLRMPFNRADYYVSRPASIPASCATKTGILYKSTISHVSGSPTAGTPLLDCVADMQVVYGLAAPDTSTVNDHTDDILLLSASEIRSRLKEIRVYILAQEGKRDTLYNYSSVSSSATVRVGEKINGIDRGRNFHLPSLIGPDYKYYRWKVYTIVVRPKNLVQ